MIINRPLIFAGEISAIYMGLITEEPPMAIPPINRAIESDQKSHPSKQPPASENPAAETIKKTPKTIRQLRRPARSAGFELIKEPRMVPTKADDTTNPMDHSESPKSSLTEAVVPAMTAVSKPNSKPPNDETAAALIKTPVSAYPFELFFIN